mgnify:CR=1 FL=1
MLYYRHHPHPPREAEADPSNEAGSPLQGAEIILVVPMEEVMTGILMVMVRVAGMVTTMVADMVTTMAEGMAVDVAEDHPTTHPTHPGLTNPFGATRSAT